MRPRPCLPAPSNNCRPSEDILLPYIFNLIIRLVVCVRKKGKQTVADLVSLSHFSETPELLKPVSRKKNREKKSSEDSDKQMKSEGLPLKVESFQ